MKNLLIQTLTDSESGAIYSNAVAKARSVIVKFSGDNKIVSCNLTYWANQNALDSNLQQIEIAEKYSNTEIVYSAAEWDAFIKSVTKWEKQLSQYLSAHASFATKIKAKIEKVVNDGGFGFSGVSIVS